MSIKQLRPSWAHAERANLARDRDDVWRLAETIQLVIDDEMGNSPRRGIGAHDG
jgi:hypothetical protein